MSEPSTITPLGTIRRKPRWQPTALALAALLLMGAGLFYVVLVMPGQYYRDRVQGLIGAPKSIVIDELGAPKYILSPNNRRGGRIDVPVEYQGYEPEPGWPARGEVLVYPDGTWPSVDFIYLDKRGNVEHIETAGT